MQPLIADGGELTVLRSLASHAWGRWKVEWPESVPEEQRPHVDEDREIGFVYKMERPVGRMGRRFVHEDVSVTAADYGPDGVVLPHSGVSDVEAVLDAAAARTDGDAFFEREITREGLGPLTPYEDFDVGDVVSVSIWGRVMDQPVTSIEAVSEAGAVIDWKVHVGGTLLADDAARRRSNEDLERTIAQERRERLKGDAKVETKAAAAQSTANAAVEDAAQLRDVLGGTGAADTTLTAQLAAINAQIQSQGGQAQPGLLPMYIQMNTQLWEQQQRVDALQDQLLHELQDAMAATKQEQADLAERRAETILATRAGSSHPDFPVLLRGDQWGLGGMFSTGDAVRVSQWERGADGVLTAPVEKFVLVASAGTVPEVQGLAASTFLEVSRMTTPLEVQRFTYRLPNVVYGDKSRFLNVTGMSVTVPKGTRSFDVSARVTWSSGWGWYTMQIARSDGTVLAERKDEGSSTIFVSKPLEQTLTVSGAEVPAGQSVVVRVQSGDRNQIGSASWAGSWTQSKS